MAIGDTAYGDIRNQAIVPGASAPGSIKSNWVVVNSDTDATAESAGTLLDPTASSSAHVKPCTVPDGAVRMLVRLGVSTTAALTYTVQPIVRFYAVDANGVATRLDASGDANAAGLTLTLTAATGLAAGGTMDGSVYGNPSTITGLDLLGNQTVYALVQTASDFTVTSGGANVVPFVVVQFLN